MALTTRIGGTNVTTAQAARWSASMLSAFIASQVGGALMAVFLCAWYVAAYNTYLFHPLNIIATFRYGEPALYNLHAAGYLWAVAFHLGVCALWGLAYGLLATALRVDKNKWAPLALGLAIGLASHIVDINLVTPALMANLHGHNIWAENVTPLAGWLGHIVFGLGFAVFPPLFRKLWLRFANRQDLLASDPRIQ
jgi:hypothetical protein